MPSDSDLPIDAVITWVDGEDPVHQAKLEAYIQSVGGTRPRTASTTRFHDSGEIEFCMRSLFKFAPWIRFVYIVTDNQSPSIIKELQNTFIGDRIKVIDHRDIFLGYDEHLPTFNTRSITTMLWRIPELSENFLYMNDDFLFIRPCNPENFFCEGKVVLRGEWRGISENVIASALKNFFSLMRKKNQQRTSYAAAQRLAANLLGFDKKYFDLPHNPHPCKKSLIESFYKKNMSLMLKNVSYKLRSPDQYVSESLMAHLAIKNEIALFDACNKTLMLKPGEQSKRRVESKINLSKQSPNFLFACVQSMEKALPDTHKLIINWLKEILN